MTDILEFSLASVLASEIVCMFRTFEDGNIYISVELRGGNIYQIARVYESDDSEEMLQRYTLEWKNATQNNDEE
uniref:Uncharacterized protein n=1 Tax=viral metagenome TaxID=1070528 RepID=A0A6C0JTV3_9ZZZZ